MPGKPRSVGIIGAGPAGLSLAVSLVKQGLHCSVYESRTSTAESRAKHAALSLQSNGLRVLDGMGLYTRIRETGFPVETMYIVDLAAGTTTSEGSDIENVYGYPRVRIYRAALIAELQAAVKEGGIAVQYGRRFSHVVSESEEGVTFAFQDGEQKTVDLLVGADGIHSRVREYTLPGAEPMYSGLCGLGAEVPKSSVQFTEEYPAEKLPVTMKHGKTVVNIVPQKNDGSRLFVGKGKILDERSQNEWKAIEADRNQMRQFFDEGLDGWPNTALSAIESINIDETYLWPVYTMPRLDRWTSKGQRVAFIGDAAHAVSPLTGQGVNQAFEDAYMLSLVLAKASNTVSVPDVLAFWQQQRMARVHEVVDRLMPQGGSQKGPAVETKSRIAVKTEEDSRGDAWLYQTDIEAAVNAWVEQV